MLVLLAAGPQGRDALIQAAMPLVPPGRAYRKAYEKRNVVRQRRGLESLDLTKPTDRDFWTGARQVCNEALAALVRGGRVTQDGDTYTLIRVSMNEGGRIFDSERHREAMKRHWIERRRKYGLE